MKFLISIFFFIASNVLAANSPDKIVEKFVRELASQHPDNCEHLVMPGSDPENKIKNMLSLRFYDQRIKELTSKKFSVSEEEYNNSGSTTTRSWVAAPNYDSISISEEGIKFSMLDGSDILLVKEKENWKIDVRKSFRSLSEEDRFFATTVAPDVVKVMKYYVSHLSDFESFESFKSTMEIDTVSFLMLHYPIQFESLTKHPRKEIFVAVRNKIDEWNESNKAVEEMASKPAISSP